MYNFVDTVSRSAGSTALPNEAVSINGQFIENVVPGYRTLQVTGRELMEAEITDQEIGNTDGTYYREKRFPTRAIVVTYQLLGKSPTEFRARFNALNKILNQEQVKLIFNDEPDKYFVGTKSEVGDVDGGLLNATGEFTFYCTDPRKYSTTEKTFAATAVNGVLETTIINNGSVPVPVDYEIIHRHENGYVGIVSEYGAIQLGSVEECDGVIRQKSQVLFDYRNPTAFGAMTDGVGTTFGNYPMNGSFKTSTVNGKQWLALDTIGNGSSWHGAGKRIILPADSNGEVGAQNFYVQAKVWFETGLSNQTGLMELAVADSSGALIASLRVTKYDLGSNNAYAIFGIRGSDGTNWEKQRLHFIPAWDGVTTQDKGHIYIKKSGELFEFYFGGGKYQFRVPSAAEKKAHSVTIFSGQHGTVPKDMLVTRMYWDYLFFQKNNVNYWVDVPNRYRSGSKIFVDGSESKIYVDGVISMDDEALGSKYFLAPPGETKVRFYHSSFSSPGPTVNCKIQEAYI